ncbi:MAG: hypothetical protein J6I41_04960 [Bacteroidales bacterium]|nr:hypothetical protein [Bacteroidales bacterium]
MEYKESKRKDGIKNKDEFLEHLLDEADKEWERQQKKKETMKYKKFIVTDVIYNKSTKEKCDEVWMMCSDDTIRTPHGDISILKWENYEKDLGETVEYFSNMKYNDSGEIVADGKRPMKVNTKLSGYSFELSGKMTFKERSYEILSALFFHHLTKMPEIENNYSGNLWWQMDLLLKPIRTFFIGKNTPISISVIGCYEYDRNGKPAMFEFIEKK